MTTEGIGNRDGKHKMEGTREWETNAGNVEGVKMEDMDGNGIGEVENEGMGTKDKRYNDGLHMWITSVKI